MSKYANSAGLPLMRSHIVNVNVNAGTKEKIRYFLISRSGLNLIRIYIKTTVTIAVNEDKIYVYVLDISITYLCLITFELTCGSR
jgi:hypothetical protein